MKHGCGKIFTMAIYKILSTARYHPKINSQGKGIKSLTGVTQGKKTSANLFSFYLSDMATAFEGVDTTDLMSPCIFAQLADDTSLYAELLSSLKERIIRMLS